MAKVNTSVSIDSDVKMQAQALLADFGMDLSTAVNVFLRQMLRERAIPFAITQEVPNADSLAALREFEVMKAHPERYRRYDSFAELLAEVQKDV